LSTALNNDFDLSNYITLLEKSKVKRYEIETSVPVCINEHKWIFEHLRLVRYAKKK